MSDVRRIAVPLAVVALAAAVHASPWSRAAPVPRADGLAEVDGARYRLATDPSAHAGTRVLPAEVRRASLSFDPAVTPADRALVLTAIASARPEARRLIDLVDGLVDLHVGDPGPTAAGTTRVDGPRYEVMLDLGRVMGQLGQRGVTRLILHELAHVLDHALLPDELIARLDAGIPRGWGCDQGRTGACTSREERFAESFAKWATGDIGVELSIGYKVPPPGPTLDAWGAPLAAFGAG